MAIRLNKRGSSSHRQRIHSQGIRQSDLDSNGQVIGNRLRQHLDPLQGEARAEQDMIEAALRSPAREGGLDLGAIRPRSRSGECSSRSVAWVFMSPISTW
jgi:hypothetical protein